MDVLYTKGTTAENHSFSIGITKDTYQLGVLFPVQLPRPLLILLMAGRVGECKHIKAAILRV